MAGIPEQIPPAVLRARAVVWLGLLAAAIGVIDGVVMMVKNVDALCAEDVYTSDGRCYDHPQAAEGLAVVVISVMLGVLILLVVRLIGGEDNQKATDLS
jgi:hypothetical protein